MSVGDAWEDEGYAGEDDWGEESVAADLEEELLEPGELGEPEAEPPGSDPTGRHGRPAARGQNPRVRPVVLRPATDSHGASQTPRV